MRHPELADIAGDIESHVQILNDINGLPDRRSYQVVEQLGPALVARQLRKDELPVQFLDLDGIALMDRPQRRALQVRENAAVVLLPHQGVPQPMQRFANDLFQHGSHWTPDSTRRASLPMIYKRPGDRDHGIGMAALASGAARIAIDGIGLAHVYDPGIEARLGSDFNLMKRPKRRHSARAM